MPLAALRVSTVYNIFSMCLMWSHVTCDIDRHVSVIMWTTHDALVARMSQRMTYHGHHVSRRPATRAPR